MSTSDLIQKLHSGDTRALARCITNVEDELSGYKAIMDDVIPCIGKAHRIGITGPPGAGKSTIVECLISAFLELHKTVGVVAVDPSSPFSGGALLGDRVRMNRVAMFEGVFIRSMASRGSLGGLAVKTMDVVDVMDAAGKDVILIETVGVGQSELEIMDAADTVVVVLVPESGDAIQTMKAGLMEIADIFMVNKADREGADKEIREIKAMLEIKPRKSDSWDIPVIKASAIQNEGISDLVTGLVEHNKFITSKNLEQNHIKYIAQHLLRSIENSYRQRIRDVLHHDKIHSACLEISKLKRNRTEVIETLTKQLCE